MGKFRSGSHGGQDEKNDIDIVRECEEKVQGCAN